MNRRTFIGAGLAAAASTQLASCVSMPPAKQSRVGKRPVLMRPGHQHDTTDATLHALAAFGVPGICSHHLKAEPAEWTVEALTALRRRVEGFGIKLEAVPLPMSSAEIGKAEMADILGSEGAERDRAIEQICQMIRNAGAAGIPMVKYNLTFLGVVRTGRAPGRGGASLSVFDYKKAEVNAPLGRPIGEVSEDRYWRRITYFLDHVVPVAEAANVRIALHPQDPGLPRGKPFHGVVPVLSNVDGLKRFVQTRPSPYHGLNFCQGTVTEMLEHPNEEICDVIRWFGSRGKIFNVHFRNIRGHVLDFQETLPDDGDIDMLRALRTYREIGYAGMVMPDHVPQITGDPGGQKAFAYCFGYIQALLQVLRNEA
jgi:mannonate dehydratase